MDKKVMTAQQKGLIIGLILVFFSVLTYTLIPDMEKQQKFGWVSLVLMVAGIAWAGIKYASDMGGNVTFGNIFGHSFKATAVMTLIIIAYFLLAATVLFPEMKEKAAQLAFKQMTERGGMTDAQINTAVDMQQKYFIPFGTAAQLAGSLLIGAIGGLIGAAIGKKNPNYTPFQQ